ncbi:MAG: DUF5012 domain-containing protein [Bacteroidaceae bacterium]|nr:DUF5012 domain-containing protein [Bacteroidaceae bacterium]
MKKILLSILMFSGLVTIASCEKKVTTEDPSTITHYVIFELNGDKIMFVPLNSKFTDPGVEASENGVDVKDKVQVSYSDALGEPLSAIDVTTPGAYNIYYSAVNVDGFPASGKRVVVVYDPSSRTDVDLSGNYVTATGTHRDNRKGTLTAFDGYKVTISNMGNGVFYISDILGGYYAQRAGYGSNYSMPGYISVNEDYSLNVISGTVAGWGDSYDSFAGTFDPATGTISYDCVYAGMDFYVIL